MKDWQYKGKALTEVPENVEAFVYVVTNLKDGRRYIGKKVFVNFVKYPPLKGRKNKRIKRKESNWKEYWGSSDEVVQDITDLGYEHFSREILVICEKRSQANYVEEYFLYKFNVLHATNLDGCYSYYNANIGGGKRRNANVRKIMEEVEQITI